MTDSDDTIQVVRLLFDVEGCGVISNGGPNAVKAFKRSGDRRLQWIANKRKQESAR